jgi:hypothetical protein
MTLRGNLRVLIEKLRLLAKPRFMTKPRFFSKPDAVVSMILRVLFLLFAGIFALTQESSDSSFQDDSVQGDSYSGDFLYGDMFSDFQNEGEEPPLVWMPPGPPRWFKSNAGGMMIEGVSSRLVALRNKYALVIDYVAPDEVDPLLLPFYQRGYTVEIRVLYERREEYRRQWLFRDEAGVTRLNAVFKRKPDKLPNDVPGGLSDDAQFKPEDVFFQDEIIEEEFIENEIIEEEFSESAEIAASAEPVSSEEDFPDEVAMPDLDSSGFILDNETAISIGFIEMYNEKARIIEDRWLFDDDSEIIISYSYNKNTLIKAETGKKIPASAPDTDPEQYHEAMYRPIYTDTYRYNRSYSLRYVERLYHRKAEIKPIRLVFPGRVLDAAADKSFMKDKLALRSDFLENISVEEGYRMTYDTDSRGRILTQTLFDSKNEAVWVIKNTWSGNRIVAMRKTEGENEKLIEYEYDRNGNRVVQRDKQNGVLERQVFTKGENETEELYLNGVVVLRAYWEKGRKVKEEQVRQR